MFDDCGMYNFQFLTIKRNCVLTLSFQKPNNILNTHTLLSLGRRKRWCTCVVVQSTWRELLSIRSTPLTLSSLMDRHKCTTSER